MKTNVTRAKNFLIVAIAIIVCVFALSDCSVNLNTNTVSNTDMILTSNSDIELTDVSEPILSDDLINAISKTAAEIIYGVEFALTPPTSNTQNKAKGSRYYIVVYKGSQSTVVYGRDSNGDYTKKIKIFTCSTGANSSPTRTGTYKIRAKYRWRYLVGGVYGQYSSSISNSYLFHSVPYYKQNASSLENEEYDKLGTPASKGCIRMCVRDCKWIYDNCPIGTEVSIVDDSGPKGAGVPQRSKNAAYDGWDPSDKWSAGNPYFNKTVSAAEQQESTVSPSDKK